MSALRDALERGLDRVAGGVCSSCGFFDPQALEDDPNLVEKIVDALKGGPRFACHDGMPHDEFGRFIPSLEQQLAAPTCGGFAAVKKELERRGLLKKLPSNLEVTLCLEVIRRGRTFPCIPSRSP